MADPLSALPPGFTVDPVASLPPGFQIDATQQTASAPPSGIQGMAQAVQSNPIASGISSIALGMASPALGLNELLDKAVYGTGQLITSAGGFAPNKVSDWMGEAAKSGGKLTDMLTADNAAFRQASGKTGFDLPRLAGTIASPMNALLKNPSSLLEALGIGGSFGAMQPVGSKGGVGTELLNTGVGSLGGAAGYGINNLLAPSAPTARQAAVDLLRKEGIEPPVGATMGDATKMIEQKGESVPFVGGAIRGAENRANTQLNQAVYNRVLAPINQSLPKDMVPGREAIQAVNSKVHDAYDAALSGISVPHDQQLAQDMQSLVANASTMHPDRLTQLNSWVQKIQDKFSRNGGVLDGDALKGLSSDIRKGAQTLLYSSDSEARDLGNVVNQLDDALLEAAKRSNPHVGPALDAADTAYTSLVRLNRAAGYNGAAGTGGVFTPANLVSAVSATARGKAAKAMGTAPMQDLSDAAAMVLKPTLPNSGTADRALSAVALALFHDPVALASMTGAWAGSHALYSKPVTGLLNSLVRSGGTGPAIGQAATTAGRLPASILSQLLLATSNTPVQR